ncbi:hypothetical protein ABPG72_019017, partial [Tetrahymena utriculariae]
SPQQTHTDIHIDLGFKAIDSEDVSTLGSALASCTILSNLKLSLNSNKIGNEGVSELGSALAKCTNLSFLTLDL